MAADDWAVFRLDFAGNRFLVEKNLPETRARQLVAEFEAHKHHQHYWAERVAAWRVDFAAMLRESLAAGSALDAALKVLKNQGASRLDCVRAVSEARGISWEAAETLVVGSTAFQEGAKGS